MSAADELLADFDDSGSDAEGEQQEHSNGLNDLYSTSKPSRTGLDGDEDEDEDEEMGDVGADGSTLPDGELGDEEEAKERVEKMQLAKVEDVRNVANLMSVLEPVLEQIAHYQSLPTPTTLVGNVEQNPEYTLLVDANAHSVSIDSEIHLVHKYIRDHYAPRFPELENLVTNPLDYAKTVAIVKNELDNIKQREKELRAILDGPTMMVVTVEASTSKGRNLSPKELERVERACEMTLALDRAKITIMEFVASRMSLFAPNTSAIIGPQTAAQLIGFTGGITGLAKTPSCNLDSLGAKGRNTMLATNVTNRKQGFLFNSPIIKSIPPDLKKQAMRIVSAKVVLAARIDRVHGSPDGSQGEQLREEVMKRLDKLTEPPPNRGPRALPAPDDKPARKRGGRKVRKAKEATAMTDLRKAQNRMGFNIAEAETGFGTGESTAGLGMIGQGDSGKIRATKIDNRTRAKLSKNNAGWGTPAGGGAASVINPFRNNAGSISSFGARGGSGLATSGTASSLAFTPVQGIELIDPKIKSEMARKRKAEEDRWFQNGTFTQVGDVAKKVDTGKTKAPGIGGLMLPPVLPGKKMK